MSLLHNWTRPKRSARASEKIQKWCWLLWTESLWWSLGICWMKALRCQPKRLCKRVCGEDDQLGWNEIIWWNFNVNSKDIPINCFGYTHFCPINQLFKDRISECQKSFMKLKMTRWTSRPNSDSQTVQHLLRLFCRASEIFLSLNIFLFSFYFEEGHSFNIIQSFASLLSRHRPLYLIMFKTIRMHSSSSTSETVFRWLNSRFLFFFLHFRTSFFFCHTCLFFTTISLTLKESGDFFDFNLIHFSRIFFFCYSFLLDTVLFRGFISFQARALSVLRASTSI